MNRLDKVETAIVISLVCSLFPNHIYRFLLTFVGRLSSAAVVISALRVNAPFLLDIKINSRNLKV